MSKGAFYLHFRTKRDAFREIVSRLLGALEDHVPRREEVEERTAAAGARLPEGDALALRVEAECAIDTDLLEILWRNRHVLAAVDGTRASSAATSSRAPVAACARSSRAGSSTGGARRAPQRRRPGGRLRHRRRRRRAPRAPHDRREDEARPRRVGALAVALLAVAGGRDRPAPAPATGAPEEGGVLPSAAA